MLSYNIVMKKSNGEFMSNLKNIGEAQIEVKSMGGISTTKSIYAKIGGEAGLIAFRDPFYDKVLAFPKFAVMFRGKNMQKQKEHLSNYLRAALGGDIPYSGSSLQFYHRPLNLTDQDFNDVAGCAVSTLQEIGVDAETVDEIAGALMSLKKDIVLSEILKSEKLEQGKKDKKAKAEQKPKKVGKCPFSGRSINPNDEFSSYEPIKKIDGALNFFERSSKAVKALSITLLFASCLALSFFGSLFITSFLN